MRRLALLAVCTLMLSGCEDQLQLTVEAAKKGVASAFKDPEAVQFADFTISADGKRACGKLNAKNGYGAYVGYESFGAALQGRGAELTVTDVKLETQEWEEYTARFKPTVGDEMRGQEGIKRRLSCK
ncbi:hypothetical protein PS645_01379 [Pseudomonas fluorescens]|uniref:Lipoprotein n=1 Tax=Pseudomonas fluorescens TaxID=294 RepID=A0A5E6R3S6_PSEFL|nr:hypothetical protein [Pseudomonas fluorescens]VVM63277.1 hypothetical protein PS645_01379 [Pseudomonas fluorescens]